MAEGCSTAEEALRLRCSISERCRETRRLSLVWGHDVSIVTHGRVLYSNPVPFNELYSTAQYSRPTPFVMVPIQYKLDVTFVTNCVRSESGDLHSSLNRALYVASLLKRAIPRANRMVAVFLFFVSTTVNYELDGGHDTENEGFMKVFFTLSKAHENRAPGISRAKGPLFWMPQA